MSRSPSPASDDELDASMAKSAGSLANARAGSKRAPPSGYYDVENHNSNHRARHAVDDEDADSPLPQHQLRPFGQQLANRPGAHADRTDDHLQDLDFGDPAGMSQLWQARHGHHDYAGGSPAGGSRFSASRSSSFGSQRSSRQAGSITGSQPSGGSRRSSAFGSQRSSHASNSTNGSQRRGSLGALSAGSAVPLLPVRSSTVAEPIVVSRLARSIYLPNLAADKDKRTATLKVLQAMRDVRPADEFFEQEFNGASMPSELADEKIGFLDVQYKDKPIAEQRRYADGPCLFSLPRLQRACASADLYTDGDLTASEPTAFAFVCDEYNLHHPKLARHLNRREQDLASLGTLAQGYSQAAQRSFSKAYLSALMHLAAVQPAEVPAPTLSDPNKTKPNAIGSLFNEHSIDWSVPLPPWLHELSSELRRLATQIVNLRAHTGIMRELRRHHPDKAARVSSALHFVLATYEYRFLDACLEKASELGIMAVSDQLDGFAFLTHTFPSDMSIDEAFREMTEHACAKTGMLDGEIREKKIILPDLMPVKSRSFLELRQRESYVDLGIAGLDVIMERMDRHFTFLVGRGGKPVVVERLFFGGTDIVDQVIERKVSDFKECYATCKITNGKTKLKIVEQWLERPERPTKLNISFEPDAAKRDADVESLDLFTGLMMDASASIDHMTAASHPGVVLILNHFELILAAGNDELYRWLLNWHAFAVQKRTKPGAIPVLIGSSGSGKSILYSQLSRALSSGHSIDSLFHQIFGQAYMNTVGLHQLTARFNMNSSGKLFVVCEEIASSGGTANKDTLKGLAEQKTMDCESKFLDTVQIADNRSIVMLSNHRRALVDTNRKFLVTEVSNQYSRDNRMRDASVDTEAKAYFDALGDALADPETVRHFFWYLMTLDLCGWSCEPVPNTDLMKLLALEANAITSWFKEFSNNELVLMYHRGRHVTSRDLLACFMSWADQNDLVLGWTEREFYLKLSEFSCSNPALLKASTHGINGKGYIMTA